MKPKPKCYYCKEEKEILYSLTYLAPNGIGSHAVCTPQGCPKETDKKI